jgi:hypothetical protein
MKGAFERTFGFVDYYWLNIVLELNIKEADQVTGSVRGLHQSNQL